MPQVLEITDAELILAETDDGSMTLTRIHGGLAERIAISAAERRRLGWFCLGFETDEKDKS